MRIRLLSLTLAIAGLALAVSPALSLDLGKMLGGPGEAPELHTFKLIHVANLAAMVGNHESNVQIYDANVPETRAKYGVIPGAHLLPSSDRYDVATTLPQNKVTPLVFYCANTRCMASHQAARRAIGAGYTNVSVMGDGIMGWKAAGQPTVAVASSTGAHS
jgi:rhodanese-related sulfurtransferase